MMVVITITALKNINHFLLDMDGTIYLGQQLIEGALPFLRLLKEQGREAIFVTNNSSKNRFDYQRKLKRMGISVNPEKIYTSGEATIRYLQKESPGANVFLLGTPVLEKDFKNAGFTLVKDSKPDVVVVGFDTTLTYGKLWQACDHIRDGVVYLATHADLNCPLEEGLYMPDAGAIISFIEASTGQKPLVIGKPNLHMLEGILTKYSLQKEDIAVVGDRLYTDIEMGLATGVTTILVLSGETNKQMYEQSGLKIPHVFPSVKEIGQALT